MSTHIFLFYLDTCHHTCQTEHPSQTKPKRIKTARVSYNSLSLPSRPQGRKPKTKTTHDIKQPAKEVKINRQNRVFELIVSYDFPSRPRGKKPQYSIYTLRIVKPKGTPHISTLNPLNAWIRWACVGSNIYQFYMVHTVTIFTKTYLLKLIY